ncbi:MAG: hypothetical protein RL538_680 [Candidatus Parcubacteria bacterium]|jgi:prepilin-type N-terminal cleavage/methylation domain-containing protein
MKAFRTGFTIVELLVSMAVIVIITGISVAGFQNYARYQRYDQEVATLRATIADAKVSARVSEGGVSHGVKFLSDRIVVFEGATYSAVDPTNEETVFSTITLTNTLSGGGSEVVFETRTGLPSVSGTVTATGIYHSGTTNVEITEAGVIQ